MPRESEVLFHHACFDDPTDSGRELTVHQHPHGISITIGLRYGSASGELQFAVPRHRMNALIAALQRA